MQEDEKAHVCTDYFVTSRDTSADELLSIQAGGIDFITKPYDTLILLEKIKRALQLSNSE